MKYPYIFLLFAFSFSFQLRAQDSLMDQDIKVNQQLWLDYNFKNFIDSTKTLNTQIGFRTISPNVFNKLLAITTLTFPHEKNLSFLNLNKPIIQSFQLGAGLYYTQNYNSNNNLEFRLAQGFKFLIPTLKGLDLINYVRLEERFQNAFNNSGWTAGYRLRYRISTKINWKKHLIKYTNGLYIPLSFEVFFNLKKSDRFNDLIRVSPGLGYKTKSDWRFEIHLIFNETKNNTETINNSSDFILRIRVFQGRLNKASKK